MLRRILPALFPFAVACGGGSDLDALAQRDTTSVTDFWMGATPEEAARATALGQPESSASAEQPRVEVEIRERVALGKYEVTFAEWDYCVEQGGCSYRPSDEGWGRGDRPVINVARRDAEEYVRWLRRHTGERYRLPSEAEWEYAARAGTTTVRYWGDALGQGHAVCDGCGSRWDARRTAPVGSLEPNPWALHDMLGNATEWVSDCWNETHAGATGDGSARTSDSPWWKDGECERPVRKGAFWQSYPWTARAAYRSSWRPGPWRDRSPMYGFRVARTR